MLSEDFKNVLIEVAKKLNKNNIQFFVIGSTNFALQGMEVSPHDLDILINYNDLVKVSEVFKDNKIKAVSKLKDKSGEGIEYDINGVEVQFVGENEKGFYDRGDRLVIVKIDSTEIPCYSLEKEAEVYKKLGRPRKAEIIRKFLENKN